MKRNFFGKCTYRTEKDVLKILRKGTECDNRRADAADAGATGSDGIGNTENSAANVAYQFSGNAQNTGSSTADTACAAGELEKDSRE